MGHRGRIVTSRGLCYMPFKGLLEKRLLETVANVHVSRVHMFKYRVVPPSQAGGTTCVGLNPIEGIRQESPGGSHLKI